MIKSFRLRPQHLRPLEAGPLAPHLGSFAGLLAQQRYSRVTGWNKLRLVAALSKWMVQTKLRLKDLNERRAAKFLERRWRRVVYQSGDKCTLTLLLQHLRQLDVVPPPTPAPLTPIDLIERDYGRHLRQERSFMSAIALDSGPHVRCTGKGRKSRCVPLRKETVTILRAWLRERNASPDAPLFPNLRGRPLSRDGVQYLLAKHVASARQQCPSLKTKRVSPHVLRHSTAMDLLQCGVDRSVIALWLGHERMDTTQLYLHASLELKEKALAKTEPFYGRPPRYRPPDQLMAFLQSL